MTPDELRDRIRTFAVEVARATRPFVSDPATRNAALQGSRSAAAFAANYRAACLAKSRRDFIAKLATVVEEADETVYWLELLRDTSPTPKPEIGAAVLDESHQLVRIVSASLATARRKRQ
jgi:four helix bundle protein